MCCYRLSNQRIRRALTCIMRGRGQCVDRACATATREVVLLRGAGRLQLHVTVQAYVTAASVQTRCCRKRYALISRYLDTDTLYHFDTWLVLRAITDKSVRIFRKLRDKTNEKKKKKERYGERPSFRLRVSYSSLCDESAMTLAWSVYLSLKRIRSVVKGTHTPRGVPEGTHEKGYEDRYVESQFVDIGLDLSATKLARQKEFREIEEH